MLLQSIMLFVLCTGTCFAATEIVVGTTLPLKAEGKQVEIGMQAAFKQINKQAGDRQLRFRLHSLDDDKKLGKAVKNIKELQKETPFFLGLFTPGVVQAIMPQIQSGRLLVFGPEENSTHLYEATPQNLVLTRPPLRDEMDVLAGHAVEKLKLHKVAIFYVDSPYGRSAVQDARAALQVHNIVPVVVASYPSGTVEIERAVNKVVEAQPDAIICLARRRATYQFLLGVVNKGLIRCAFLGASYLLPMQEFLKKVRGIDLIATSVEPNPWQSQDDEIKSYRRAMHEYFVDERLSPISLTSYLTARSFAGIVQDISGPPTPTAVGRAAALRNLIGPIWLSEGFGKPWRQVQK